MKTYSEKLRDPRWQKMRLKIMERDGFTCQFCWAKKETLNVHHAYYDKGAAPWEYDESVLVTCCEGCHADIEESKKELGKILIDPMGREALYAFVRTFKEAPVEIAGVLGMTDGRQIGLLYDLLISQFQRAERILK